MSIMEDVSALLTQAMKARDTVRTTALRGIRAAFLNEVKKDGAEKLPDERAVQVLRRLEKQHRESIESFRAGGREARAQAEAEQLDVVREFLPALADAERTRAWVQAAIEASGARTPADMGRVMGALMKAHRGEVDGGLAREIAAKLLAG